MSKWSSPKRMPDFDADDEPMITAQDELDAIEANLKKCVRCGGPAVHQTANGKYQQEIGGLPQNHGWYCWNCVDEGYAAEKEAMNE